jgi:carboxymethylenebutenolidase
MRNLAIGAGILTAALALPACAQDWAKANLEKSPRHGEYVTLNEPGARKVQAWVVYPEVKEKAPVVVLIHEIFGMSDWSREMADEIAGAGYIVVEPDLLSGYGPATHATTRIPIPALPGMGCDPMGCPPAVTSLDKTPHLEFVSAQQAAQDHSHMQMPANTGQPFVPMQPGGTAAFPDISSITNAVSHLPDAGVLADLDAAADYGNHLPAASGKLFVTGFCWGGGKTFLFATHRHDLSGAFVFYGPPPAPELMKNISAPVYGFYAGNDARITATVPQTTQQMKAAGKTYEPVVYDGAGHGFMRAGEAPDANAANSAARQEGFRRLVNLLGGVR